MITIRPIREHEIQSAKHVILTVAYGIFGWEGTLEESIQYFESTGTLDDMDDFQAEYIDRDGLFLAVLDDETLIGSGAIRKIDEEIAELKRMWLLEAYHGKGLGFALMQQLLEFARGQGYGAVRLQTSPRQARAIHFYKGVGFREIPCYNDDTSEISMELPLSGTNPQQDTSSLKSKEAP